ncbi:hypothetical protein ACWEP4_44645 [Streptomyces sp. NPDC004227]
MASDLSAYPRFVLFGSLHQDSFIDAGAGMDERDELGCLHGPPVGLGGFDDPSACVRG